MQEGTPRERNVRKLNHLPLSVRFPIEEDNPGIVRWEEKCIRCGMCRTACTNLIGVHGTYTLEETGGKAICIYCGQCANVCPVDSITERDESPAVRQAVAAMEAKGHTGEELLLVYLDGGSEELVSASWAAARALDTGR